MNWSQTIGLFKQKNLSVAYTFKTIKTAYTIQNALWRFRWKLFNNGNMNISLLNLI